MSNLFNDISGPRVHIGPGHITVLLLAGVALLIVAIVSDLPIRISADARTELGSIQRVDLPDGSVAILDADSAISIDYTDSARAIRLLRGRAEFTVARDPEHPFTVLAANGLLRPLGNRFVVARKDDVTAVTALDDKVGVRSPLASEDELILDAGQEVEYDQDNLGAVRTANVEAALSWTRECCAPQGSK